MSAWWLVLIIPLSASAGLVAAALLNIPRRSEPAPEPPAAPPAPQIVRVTRYIPKDVWMERILETDVKTANAQLAVSMGQMLGPELAPYTTVRALYRPEQGDYQITAWVWVLPREGRK